MTKAFAAALLTVLLSVSAVLAAEPQVFKNTDLEKYSTGSGTGSPQVAEPPRPAANSGQQRKAEDKSSASAKFWCDSATQADRRIKMAEENLSHAKSRKAETWRSIGYGNRMTSVEADARAQRNLESAEAELATAKKDKERLEGEAHQKSIPPGWLRCQFE